MHYIVKHATHYRYSVPIRESQMEVRMQPRTEGGQRCWDFQLRTSPKSAVASYRDTFGNIVHHFDVPGRHDKLSIVMEALVELTPPPPLPEAGAFEDWAELQAMIEDPDVWELLQPSRFARPTEKLAQLSAELGLRRLDDPISTLRAVNSAIRTAFDYVPRSTRVDSPIDDALESRRGVCQDFTHIFLALTRGLGIPSRYVSGYLFHRGEDDDRLSPDATHAWAEALVPGYGWVGFDPTNDLVVADRHIRAAIGRDYADVPPTRGVFKGDAKTDTALGVEVRVATSPAPLPIEEPIGADDAWARMAREEDAQQQ